ncbi:NF-kappa-B-activating protein-like [Patiria miniata]|uniref:NF-kappa-B-activating protein C-terminal domain-containing protein n=1 Tax=Patiria miniata TaxID=46514 RepID=A0A913ZEZ4_PATMI|nr:NF-kappa-B-activating protein-like [Patiria miniata]XP_038050352.1 NF-kappa-B-activating protein-like [Patiria miniata]
MGYSDNYRDRSPTHHHRDRHRERSRDRDLKEHSRPRKSRSRSRSPEHRDRRGPVDDRDWNNKYRDDIRLNGHGERHRRSSGDWRQEAQDQQERFFESRRTEREKIMEQGLPDVWAASPERAEHDSDQFSNTEKDKDDSDASSSTDSEEERRRRKKKSKKSKRRKEKKRQKKSKKRGKRKRKTSSSEESSDSDSDSEEEQEQWVEKTAGARNDSSVVGPLPAGATSGSGVLTDFGRALLPGEGAAMAAFVEAGKRIPRRGEIGLTSGEISKFEDVGYVMSGSRHRRMEAVRMRKENQIYSADEKRALASFNKEERGKREDKILRDFREMVHKKVKERK